MRQMDVPNVLWITVDALRRDGLSCYGDGRHISPFIDGLAEQAIVYDRAFATAPWTLPSVASMFTGLYPSEHGAVDERSRLRSGVPTVADVARRHGYDTAIVTQNDGWITPVYGLTRGFDRVYDLDAMVGDVGGFSFGSRRLQLMWRGFCKYLAGYRRVTLSCFRRLMTEMERPFFVYVHLMDTHLPYEPRSLLPFFSFFRRMVLYRDWKRKMRETWTDEYVFSGREMQLLRRFYMAAARQVDAHIRRLVSLAGDNTVVIVTADHGEHLDRTFLGHQFSFADDVLAVPLIVYHPRMEPRHVKGLFEMKDIFRLLQQLFEGDVIEDLCERDYVYGESRELGPVYEKLSRRNPSLARGGSYLRTKKVKYLNLLNDKNFLYHVNGEEKIFKNKKALRIMKDLMAIKKKQFSRRDAAIEKASGGIQDE
ncbi:MAG: sulfatase [Candidatus Thermoplasmatota archaeon]|nr:sulfatase [Candidatus Thermoplasmatota archaeon]